MESGREPRAANAQEILMLTGKLNHASYLIRPGLDLIPRLLQLSELYMNWEELVGGGGAWGRLGIISEMERLVVSIQALMVNVVR